MLLTAETAGDSSLRLTVSVLQAETAEASGCQDSQQSLGQLLRSTHFGAADTSLTNPSDVGSF